MALSLPYNIVFVPLDVLTAEELNNLMSDINYISNQFPLSATNIGSGAIGATQLASSAVTAAKFSYGDVLRAKYASSSSTMTLATSLQTLMTVDISAFPTGSEILALGVATFNGSSSEAGVNLKFVSGTQESLASNQVTTWGKNLSVLWQFTKLSSQTSIQMRAAKDNTTAVQFTYGAMSVLRVG